METYNDTIISQGENSMITKGQLFTQVSTFYIHSQHSKKALLSIHTPHSLLIPPYKIKYCLINKNSLPEDTLLLFPLKYFYKVSPLTPMDLHIQTIMERLAAHRGSRQGTHIKAFPDFVPDMKRSVSQLCNIVRLRLYTKALKNHSKWQHIQNFKRQGKKHANGFVFLCS